MPVPLIEFILDLLSDEKAKEEFGNNPKAALAAAGLSDCGAELKEVAPFVLDHPGVKPAHAGDDDDHERPDHDGRDGHGKHDGHGDDDVEVAIRYLKYISKNYTYNDNDVTYDNSFKQNFWNEGELELNQHIDNDQTIASGDGSVAAGDDIQGNVTTGDNNTVVSGDENVVGDGNVDGNNNDVANGDGSAAGKGAVAGSFGNGANVATTGGEIDNSQETEVDVEIKDSFQDNDQDNDVTVKKEIEVEDNDKTVIKDSYNEEETVTQKGLLNVNEPEIEVAPLA